MAIIEDCIFPVDNPPSALSTYDFLVNKIGQLNGRSGREFKINVAERVLRSILGSDVIARAAIDNVPCDGKLRVIESVGGSEMEFLKAQFTARGCSYGVINLRSFGEKPGVDLRELDRDPNACTLWLAWDDKEDVANFLELVTLLLPDSDKR